MKEIWNNMGIFGTLIFIFCVIGLFTFVLGGGDAFEPNEVVMENETVKRGNLIGKFMEIDNNDKKVYLFIRKKEGSENEFTGTFIGGNFGYDNGKKYDMSTLYTQIYFRDDDYTGNSIDDFSGNIIGEDYNTLIISNNSLDIYKEPWKWTFKRIEE